MIDLHAGAGGRLERGVVAGRQQLLLLVVMVSSCWSRVGWAFGSRFSLGHMLVQPLVERIVRKGLQTRIVHGDICDGSKLLYTFQKCV